MRSATFHSFSLTIKRSDQIRHKHDTPSDKYIETYMKMKVIKMTKQKKRYWIAVKNGRIDFGVGSSCGQQTVLSHRDAEDPIEVCMCVCIAFVFVVCLCCVCFCGVCVACFFVVCVLRVFLWCVCCVCFCGVCCACFFVVCVLRVFFCGVCVACVSVVCVCVFACCELCVPRCFGAALDVFFLLVNVAR